MASSLASSVSTSPRTSRVSTDASVFLVLEDRRDPPAADFHAEIISAATSPFPATGFSSSTLLDPSVNISSSSLAFSSSSMSGYNSLLESLFVSGSTSAPASPLSCTTADSSCRKSCEATSPVCSTSSLCPAVSASSPAVSENASAFFLQNARLGFAVADSASSASPSADNSFGSVTVSAVT